MKNFIIPILAFSVFSFLFVSCAGEAPSLEGSWSASSAKLNSTHYDESMTSLIEQQYQGTIIAFGPENTFNLSRGSEQHNGSYSLDESAKTLTFNDDATNNTGWSEQYTVENQTGTELTLSQNVDTKGSTISLVLKKQ